MYENMSNGYKSSQQPLMDNNLQNPTVDSVVNAKYIAMITFC